VLLEETETTEQIQSLIECRINIGFARLFDHKTPGMGRKLMLSEKYLIAFPSNHRLSKFKTVLPSMLGDEALIIFPEKIQPELYKNILCELESGGYRPKLIQEAITKQTTLALVEAGMGIAFIPQSVTPVKRKGIEFRHFSANLPKINIYAIWRKDDNSPLLEKFVKLVELYSRRFSVQ
jgi:DNA-binding transcriptional LysR family regulator